MSYWYKYIQTLLQVTNTHLRILDSESVACQQSFIALGNAKTSLFLALLRKIILLIPLIYIMPLFIHDKTTASTTPLLK